MTTLTFGTKTMKGPRLGGASEFPAIREPIKSTIRSKLDEDDGLFINYGMLGDSLPFTMQDNYDTEPIDQTFSTAVLENSHLRATFVLDLGARLWSLYDKDAGRDLITDNPEFRPKNLAIRNAWFAGGIEYNVGRRGHDDQTCSPRFAAELKDDDGTPVLRIYEFDRNQAVPFQLDYYLPENSKFLFARMRIMNINDTVVPMYWWSNIAVRQVEGARVVVPCFDTFANTYNAGSHYISKIKLPDGDGYDGTYPTNFPCARDYFFHIPDGVRKYETVVFPDGYGFLFASTSRLKGRKLFVWGQGQGGRHWQRKLMGSDEDYLEIQGGVGYTQQECVPMPPRTTWEWLEAYGAVNTEPAKVFGDWPTAVGSVSQVVDDILPADFLEAELARTRKTFAKREGTVRFRGSGWGALEEQRLGRRLVDYLDFGQPQEEQADWTALLKTGTMPADGAPSGYMIQAEWRPLLAAAPAGNWKVLCSQALYAIRDHDFEKALQLAERSCQCRETPWNTFVRASVKRLLGDREQALQELVAVVKNYPDHAPLAKEALKIMIEQKADPQIMLDVIAALTPNVQQRPMVIYCQAYALAHQGHLDEAENLILADDGLEIPDIREGECSISDLYIFIQQERARLKGETLAAADVKVPFNIDLRMS